MSFSRKECGNNSIAILLLEQNWETKVRFFFIEGMQRMLLKINDLKEENRVIKPIWVIRSSISSPMWKFSIIVCSKYMDSFFVGLQWYDGKHWSLVANFVLKGVRGYEIKALGEKDVFDLDYF